MYSYKLNNSYTVYVDYTYLNECIKICRGDTARYKRKNSTNVTTVCENVVEKKNVVKMGTKVYVLDLDTQEKVLFTIENSRNTNPSKRIISDVSPVGRALIGHGLEEVVTIHIPCGMVRYKILDLRN